MVEIIELPLAGKLHMIVSRIEHGGIPLSEINDYTAIIKIIMCLSKIPCRQELYLKKNFV